MTITTVGELIILLNQCDPNLPIGIAASTGHNPTLAFDVPGGNNLVNLEISVQEDEVRVALFPADINLQLRF